MRMRGVDIELVVVAGNEPADVALEEAEDEEDLKALIESAAERTGGSLVLDLRCAGRPRVALPTAIELAVAALAGTSAAPRVRAMVEREEVAARLAERLSGGQGGHRSEWKAGPVVIELQTGDIVAVVADAVVNASNTSLKLGSGVSAALKRACGPGLQAEMSRHAPIEPGGLAVTGAHGLGTAPTILHVATASGGPDVVDRAVKNILGYAARRPLRSVAIPGLGMGTGGLAADRAARIFADAIASHAAVETQPALVRVVLWAPSDYAAFEAAFASDPRFTAEG